MIMMMMGMTERKEEESHLLRKPNEEPCKLRCRAFPTMPISQCHHDDDDDDDGRDDDSHTYGHDIYHWS